MLIIVLGRGSNLVKHAALFAHWLGSLYASGIEEKRACRSLRRDEPRRRDGEEAKEPFLAALGERAKALRTRRGLTRKALARATGVSERHLANLEYGVGNASILVLLQVAQALQCSLAELVGDVTTQSPEWLLLREMLADRDEATLRRVRLAALELIGGASPPINETPVRSSRIALDRPARRGQIDAGPHAGGGSRLSVRRAQPRD